MMETATSPYDWDNMRNMIRDSVGKRRHYPFQGQHDVSYKRFRSWIIQRSNTEAPAVSTPLATGWQQRELSFELDTVRQRLELDSPPPRHYEEAHRGQQVALEGTPLFQKEAVIPQNLSYTMATTRGRSTHVPEQGWMWRAAAEECVNTQQTGSDVGTLGLQPFTLLNQDHGTSVTKLAAPSLLNDYYTNVLDCSSSGVVALALGSSVHLWNSETRAAVGCLSEPEGGRRRHQPVSSLCWSRDGRALGIGTRRGEVQLWDVEKQQNTRQLPSHLSAVGALSWKHNLLSSGSVLGRIHHLDPRAPAPLVGVASQDQGICSLQWSPGGQQLASGSMDGLLHVWDGDMAGTKQPLRTMRQPSAVKAMGWCPWRRQTIATGGGWTDGALRVWDTEAGTCVTSVDTNSQVCSLRWAKRRRSLLTGHGRPHHAIACWSWDSTSLILRHQLTGHSQRVLHLTLNPDETQMFSAAADHSFHIWDL